MVRMRFAWVAVVVATGCALPPYEVDPQIGHAGGTGGTTGNGGAPETGGDAAGGSPSGGSDTTGGRASGGRASGGSPAGGNPAGGSPSGGAPAAGAAGDSPTGGSTVGGAAGGTPAGGTAAATAGGTGGASGGTGGGPATCPAVAPANGDDCDPPGILFRCQWGADACTCDSAGRWNCEPPTGQLGLYGGGWVVAGPLYGWAFTAVADDIPGLSTTIAPPDFADAGELCVSGSVAPDFGSVAMLGFNVRQHPGTGELELWTPTHEGLIVNLRNPDRTPLRVQIQGPNGGEDPLDRWCVDVPDFGVPITIPWGEFRTDCWGTTGEPYEGQPLEQILVLVPGDEDEERPFDFCLDDLGLAGLDQTTECLAGEARRPCLGEGACRGVIPCLDDGTWDWCHCGGYGWYPGCPSTKPAEGDACGLSAETSVDTFCPYPSGGCTCTMADSWDCPADASAFGYNGWTDDGTWYGWAYTFAGNGTVNPVCGADDDPCFKATGSQFCVSGQLDDVDGFAGFGRSIHVDPLTHDILPWATTGTDGVYVSVIKNAATDLRVNINTPTDGYCATFTEDAVLIPWDAFRVNCWETPPGESFQPGDEIENVEVTVPGQGSTYPLEFDYCIQQLEPQ